MSMSDPIADMLTRIRNGQQARKVSVAMPAAKLKSSVAKVLQDEGYIQSFETAEVEGKPTLTVTLKIIRGCWLVAISLPCRKLRTSDDMKEAPLSEWM